MLGTIVLFGAPPRVPKCGGYSRWDRSAHGILTFPSYQFPRARLCFTPKAGSNVGAVVSFDSRSRFCTPWRGPRSRLIDNKPFNALVEALARLAESPLLPSTRNDRRVDS